MSKTTITKDKSFKNFINDVNVDVNATVCYSSKNEDPKSGNILLLPSEYENRYSLVPNGAFKHLSNDCFVDEYYQAISIALNSIAAVIADSSSLGHFSFVGRDGSSSFEDNFLKPLIREFRSVLYEPVNNSLERHGLSHWEFIDIFAEEDLNESSARTMEDVSIIMRRPNGLLFEEAVNIKATLGNNADNVGGWVSIDRAVFGNSPDGKYARQRGAFLKKVTTTKITDSLSDYFLWIFIKSGNGHEVMYSSHVNSFFGTNTDSFIINKNQSFPLQFNTRTAVDMSGSGLNIVTRKTRLLHKVHSEMVQKLSQEVESHQAALNAINKTTG